MVEFKQFLNLGGLVSDLKSFNFSVYGQYFGYINVILCMALGIANLFHFHPVLAFGIVAIVQSLIILFVEVPFLLKICPLSDNFISFIKRFETNGWRLVFFSGMAIIQWCSLILKVTSLLVIAISLSISAIFYLVAMIKNQEFNSGASVVKNPTDQDFPHEAVVREML